GICFWVDLPYCPNLNVEREKVRKAKLPETAWTNEGNLWDNYPL
ncbi:unnamed protein product, partial [marine sediment metagenome]